MYAHKQTNARNTTQPRPKRKRKVLYAYDEDGEAYDLRYETSKPGREGGAARRVSDTHVSSILNDRRKFVKDWTDFHLNRCVMLPHP